jgi:hypothetical protein
MTNPTKQDEIDGLGDTKSSNTSLPPKSPKVGVGEGVEILQLTPKKSWKSYIWDTLDKSPEERRFLFKLDAVLMTLASLGYFIKYLDQVDLPPLSLISSPLDDSQPVIRSMSTTRLCRV